jgi:GMP synthase PP-ATPase subunit
VPPTNAPPRPAAPLGRAEGRELGRALGAPPARAPKPPGPGLHVPLTGWLIVTDVAVIARGPVVADPPVDAPVFEAVAVTQAPAVTAARLAAVVCVKAVLAL